MASKLAHIDKEAVRIAKQECTVYNKQLYTINSSFAHHADGGITRGINIRLYGDDPDVVYSALCDALWVSTTNTTPLLAVTKKIDSTLSLIHI